MDKLIKAFQDHIAAPIPNNLIGEEVDGIDLILLDNDSAAIIDKYISHKGFLNEADLIIAQSCQKELEVVAKSLNGLEREYFKGLEAMISEVLQF